MLRGSSIQMVGMQQLSHESRGGGAPVVDVVVVVGALYSDVEDDTAVAATTFATTASIAASVAHAADVDGPPLPPRIVDRSNLVKLELRMDTSPPSKPVAPVVLVGS